MVHWSPDYIGLDVGMNNKYIVACFLFGVMIAKIIISGFKPDNGVNFYPLYRLIKSPNIFNTEDEKQIYIFPCIGLLISLIIFFIISSSTISMFDEQYFVILNSILFFLCIFICYKLTGQVFMLTIICLILSSGIYTYALYKQRSNKINGIHFTMFIVYFFIIIAFL